MKKKPSTDRKVPALLYVGENGDIEHSGLIVRIDLDPLCIFVLSKWGRYKEAIHTLLDCDYNSCTHEFWRINLGIAGIQN